MSLLFRPVVQHSPLKRRFYHLGEERDERPPRDYEDSSVPPDEKLSYVPRSFGANGDDDVQRLSLFDASGEAPPKPHYLTDIDRARHFVQLQGGMDVAAHFANRPAYLLCRGGSLPMMHSETYKNVLAARAAELTALEAQLTATDAKKRQEGTSSPAPKQLSSAPPTQQLPHSCSLSSAEPASPASVMKTFAAVATALLGSPSPAPESLLRCCRRCRVPPDAWRLFLPCSRLRAIPHQPQLARDVSAAAAWRVVMLQPAAALQLCDVLPCGDKLTQLASRVGLPWLSSPVQAKAPAGEDGGMCPLALPDAHTPSRGTAAQHGRRGPDPPGGALTAKTRPLVLDPYTLPHYRRLSASVDAFLQPSAATRDDDLTVEAILQGWWGHAVPHCPASCVAAVRKGPPAPSILWCLVSGPRRPCVPIAARG